MTAGPPGPLLRCRRIVVREPKRAGRLALLGLLLLVIGTPLASMACGGFGFLVPLALAVYVFLKAARSGSATSVQGAIRLDEDAVRLFCDGQDHGRPELFRVLALGAITSGYETMDERTVVLRSVRGEEALVELERDEPARVLRHAGVDVAQRALELPLRRTLGAFTIGFVAFWPLLVMSLAFVAPIADGGWTPLLSLACASLATALVVRRLGFPRVVVGAEGVRFLGTVRRRYFPHDAIARVEAVAPAAMHASIRLHLRDGMSVTLPTVAAPRERIEGLVRRIEKARAEAVSGAARRLDGLARGGRTLAAWRADIERLALTPPGFRDHATGRDDFERVLADAGAPADQRVGAALALRVLDPEAAAPRIRIAADASADETLRDALAAAAEGDVEESLLDRVTSLRA